MLRQGHVLTLMLKILIKILGFKLVVMGEYQFSYLLKSSTAQNQTPLQLVLVS